MLKLWLALVALGLALPATAQPPLPELPTTAPSDGAVILHITDTHIADASTTAELKELIDFANAAIRPDATVVTGDLSEDGTEPQLELYKQTIAALRGPVFHLPGNHDWTAGAATYQRLFGPSYYAKTALGLRLLALNSCAVDAAQLDFLRRELAAADQQKLPPLVFLHHNLLSVPAGQAELRRALAAGGVRFLVAGHTHVNSVVNTGSMVQVTTTATRTPLNRNPKGYALLTIDQGRPSWHSAQIGQHPVLAIANPMGRLMATGPEAAVRNQIEIRVRVYDTAALTKVWATIDDGPEIPLVRNPRGLWTCRWDSTQVKDGDHVLLVQATNNQGATAREGITFSVNQAGEFQPRPGTLAVQPLRRPASAPATAPTTGR